MSTNLKNNTEHRTPWWAQIVGLTFALLSGAIGGSLILVHLLGVSKTVSSLISIGAFIFAPFLLVPQLLREHEKKQTRFLELTGLEKLSVIAGLVLSILSSLILWWFWVRA